LVSADIGQILSNGQRSAEISRGIRKSDRATHYGISIHNGIGYPKRRDASAGKACGYFSHITARAGVHLRPSFHVVPLSSPQSERRGNELIPIARIIAGHLGQNQL